MRYNILKLKKTCVGVVTGIIVFASTGTAFALSNNNSKFYWFDQTAGIFASLFGQSNVTLTGKNSVQYYDKLVGENAGAIVGAKFQVYAGDAADKNSCSTLLVEKKLQYRDRPYTDVVYTRKRYARHRICYNGFYRNFFIDTKGN